MADFVTENVKIIKVIMRKFWIIEKSKCGQGRGEGESVAQLGGERKISKSSRRVEKAHDHLYYLTWQI